MSECGPDILTFTGHWQEIIPSSLRYKMVFFPGLVEYSFSVKPTPRSNMLTAIPRALLSSLILSSSALAAAISGPADHSTVLILGGGVAGVIAARTLHQKGIEDFKIVEARPELGGRLQSFSFGAPGKEYILENGAK